MLPQALPASTLAQVAAARRLYEPARQLQDVCASPQVIRGLFTLAWQLRCLSHDVLAMLNDRLGQLSRQTTRWPQWFERELG